METTAVRNDFQEKATPSKPAGKWFITDFRERPDARQNTNGVLVIQPTSANALGQGIGTPLAFPAIP